MAVLLNVADHAHATLNSSQEASEAADSRQSKQEQRDQNAMANVGGWRALHAARLARGAC